MESDKKIIQSGSSENIPKFGINDLYGGKTLITLLEMKLFLTTNPNMLVVPIELSKLIDSKISGYTSSYSSFIGRAYLSKGEDVAIYYYILDANILYSLGILITVSRTKSGGVSINLSKKRFDNSKYDDIRLDLNNNKRDVRCRSESFHEIDFKEFATIFNQYKYLKDVIDMI